jgi:Xaa-Pro aminopeptidase
MQRVALQKARPGVATHQIEASAEEVLKTGGYEEHFIRGFLHGIGLSFEEMPFPTIFPEDVLVPLEAGMTLAFGHPILAVPGIGGVRVEDTVLLEDSGPVFLTSSPRDEIIVV